MWGRISSVEMNILTRLVSFPVSSSISTKMIIPQVRNKLKKKGVGKNLRARRVSTARQQTGPRLARPVLSLVSYIEGFQAW